MTSKRYFKLDGVVYELDEESILPDLDIGMGRYAPFMYRTIHLDSLEAEDEITEAEARELAPHLFE